MTYCPHEEEYRGYTISILNEEAPPNPRKEWDQLGTLITWDRDYISPDPRDFPGHESFAEWYAEHPAIVVGLSRNRYDGSLSDYEYSPRADDHDGVAYLPADIAIDNWPAAMAYERALDCLRAEVREYSHWAAGNCWYFVVASADGERVDSCGGFVGDYDEDDGCLDAAREAVDALIAHATEADAHEARMTA